MTYLPFFDPPEPDLPLKRSLRIVVSSSASARLTVARETLGRGAPGARVLVVGASRAAADDLVREVAASVPATFGIERLSLTQLAAKTAVVSLASRAASSSTSLGAEAVATRAAFSAVRDASLGYFAPVAATPGFPRALARTLQELRLAHIGRASLAPLPLAGPDLAILLDRFETCFTEARSVDRADLFRTAASALRDERERAGRALYDSVVLLDVSLDQAAEREFIDALIGSSLDALAVVPQGDRDAVRHLEAMGGAVENPEIGAATTDLTRIGIYLFDSESQPSVRELDGSVEFYSAPGEGRECVEMARRALREARRGVRFDEMAILVRSPHSYFGLLEHALRRADIPAWFDRGTRRPHPAGRAFLALLACAAEQLSAARFSEYLSLGQVPETSTDARDATRASSVALPLDEALGLPDESEPIEDAETASESESEQDESTPVVAGTLRAPWRWERLLVESAVIGHDASRWRRRLAGKAAEIDAQLREVEREDGRDGPRVQFLRSVRDELKRLEEFALPIVDELASWPRTATWGDWLDRFSVLVPRVLRAPGQVLRILADLRPMSDVGPIDLDEARRVLSERLLTLESSPPSRRFGRIFVGTPQQARGRSFRVVFVPGLAERMFPQKPREDPLLLDALRMQADSSLVTQPHRLAAERLLLQLAAGAASERLYVSYPRIDLSESRARVPSFYALDLMRAATGRVPDYEWLEAHASAAGNATLAWPAPSAPEDAIDEQEHDLAVLRSLLDEPNLEAVKGHAHYLLKLNECLRRSVVNRWARGEPRWSVSDGLIRVSLDTGPALAAQRLTARSYSLTTLQRFSACPYQFVLSAFYRLQPVELPEPLQRLDPLTRGSLFHEIQARFFRALKAQGALPVTVDSIGDAAVVLDATVDSVATAAYDTLAPAVDRVWHDEIASIRRDLHGWLQHLARDGNEWLPEKFEFSFGTVPGERDASSIHDEVTLPGGFRLRGAIDLIESHRTTGVLRVTDHKTGRKPDKIDKVIVGGGAVLQPVLYPVAIETALGRRVSHGRLFYCTATGGYAEHPIPLNDTTRAAGLEVLEVIDRAVANGFLAPTPTEDACGRCDYRAVCGSDMWRRTRRKPQDRIADLLALRSRP